MPKRQKRNCRRLLGHDGLDGLRRKSQANSELKVDWASPCRHAIPNADREMLPRFVIGQADISSISVSSHAKATMARIVTAPAKKKTRRAPGALSPPPRTRPSLFKPQPGQDFNRPKPLRGELMNFESNCTELVGRRYLPLHRHRHQFGLLRELRRDLLEEGDVLRILADRFRRVTDLDDYHVVRRVDVDELVMKADR
jgi:hypothetical protein